MPQSVLQLPKACTPLHNTMLGHQLLTARQSASAFQRATAWHAACPLFGSMQAGRAGA